MKHTSTKQARVRRPVTRASAELSDLKKLIMTVERRLETQITHLRDELRASETALAAARLRALNERQSAEGVVRLRADLEAMRKLGIIDDRGRRVRKELPAEMSGGTSDVV